MGDECVCALWVCGWKRKREEWEAGGRQGEGQGQRQMGPGRRRIGGHSLDGWWEVGGGKAGADAGAGGRCRSEPGPAGMSVLRSGILLVGDDKMWDPMCKR